jgi:hypothetical protein
MKIILLSIAAVFLTSCAAYRSAVDEIGDNSVLVAPVVTLVTAVVFDKAVSEEDKVEKAKIVNDLADKLITLELSAKPTREEFLAKLLENLPAKTHWITLATLLSTQYEKATAKISNDDVTKTVAVIKEIAIGLKSATARYTE